MPVGSRRTGQHCRLCVTVSSSALRPQALDGRLLQLRASCGARAQSGKGHWYSWRLFQETGITTPTFPLVL